MLKGLLIGILVSLASFLVILAIYRVEKTRELAKKVLLKIEQWFEKKMEEFEESAKENGVIFTLLGKTALINFVVLTICIVMLLCITLKFNFFIGLGVFIIIFGYYMYKGWIKIPNDPPQKGVITIFGRRMKGAIYIKKEGLIFLAFYPWLQNIMLVKKKKKKREKIGKK